MNDVTERFNKLAVESTQTVVDTAFHFQRQNSTLIQNWFNVLEANQKASRDLVGKSVAQVVEAQQLWYKLGTELFRNATEAWTHAAGVQAKWGAEQAEKAAKQVSNGAKTPAASK